MLISTGEESEGKEGVSAPRYWRHLKIPFKSILIKEYNKLELSKIFANVRKNCTKETKLIRFVSQHHVSMKLVYGHNFIMVGFSGPMVRGASPLEVSQTWPVPEPELFSSNLLGKLASAWENNLKPFREPVASSGQYYLANKKKYYLETAANDLYEMFSCSLVIIWP